MTQRSFLFSFALLCLLVIGGWSAKDVVLSTDTLALLNMSLLPTEATHYLVLASDNGVPITVQDVVIDNVEQLVKEVVQ